MPETTVRKEIQALQGTWKAVSMEAGGEPVPAEAAPGSTFIVGTGGKSTGRMAGSEYIATITVDPGKNPKTLDMLHESGAQKGKRQYGVYKLEGDTWTVGITGPGAAEGDRPKDFSTKGTANALFVFERVRGRRLLNPVQGSVSRLPRPLRSSPIATDPRPAEVIDPEAIPRIGQARNSGLSIRSSRK